MINSIKYLLFIVFISFSNAEEKPIKINITGNVLDKNVNGLKGAKLVIENNNGEKLENEKSGKEGKFKFKKIKLFPGEYILKGNHKTEGSGEITFFVDSVDVELTLVIPTKKEEPVIPIQEKLPQQKTITEKETLKFEEYFFEYESNLEALKGEIDSLKSVVKGYQKKQTMPNVGREILDLIVIPEYQHRVELQNGTVVSGALIEETDSTLTLKTQIGTLVLKKEMVVKMDELKKPGPKVVFLGDPFIDYYPSKQIFSGKVKNVGEIRADFVRIVVKLFDQTTKSAGRDSIFVKGDRTVYETNVIADTALKPGKTASYSLTVPIKKGRKAEYHTMDIHWEQTK
ncbi:MAG: hypothetical protein CMF99_05845 [Candidatus Marinimicrobia bacterium]|nr:hypothetical protein [Candidatus Neomarinimicrobiota bacterium]